MKPLPIFLKRYFWDIDFSSLDKQKYPDFIIARILDQGDQKAIDWLENNFGSSKIKKVFAGSRSISRRSANYWQLIFNMKKDEILCFKKSFQKKLEPTWKY